MCKKKFKCFFEEILFQQKIVPSLNDTHELTLNLFQVQHLLKQEEKKCGFKKKSLYINKLLLNAPNIDVFI